MYYCVADVSGRSVRECVLLAYRSPYEDMGPKEQWEIEHLVVRWRDGTPGVVRSGQGLARMWAAPEGPVYLSTHPQGTFRGLPDSGNGYRWEELPELGTVGFFGRSDEDVFAWREDASRTAIFRGRAGVFQPSLGPAGICAMGGSTGNVVCAAGEHGLVARQDGREGWQLLPAPTSQRIDFVWGHQNGAVSAATRSGAFFHHTGEAWTSARRQYKPILAMTELGGHLIVARDVEGLWRPKDARGHLEKASDLSLQRLGWSEAPIGAKYYGMRQLEANGEAGPMIPWGPALDSLLGASSVSDRVWCAMPR